MRSVQSIQGGRAQWPSADVAREIDARLTRWFQQFQRPLKFRQSIDPYAVMVSEFMLQQTTVAAVEPFFVRFMKQYPNVFTLASATEDEVMLVWAGLGYYRRARQLHAAANTIVSKFNGEFPDNVMELQKLPGFGRYTAGAVVSQAFNTPAAIVEANTVRVFARLAGLLGTVGDSGFMKQLWGVSEALIVSADSPRTFNRAAMELGALICRVNPACSDCPVQLYCTAYSTGMTHKTPRMRPRLKSVEITAVCLAMRDNNGHYGVRKIPTGQWHAGMWEFPSTRTVNGMSDFEHALQLGKLFPGAKLTTLQPLTNLKYQVTHHKVSCSVFHCHALNCKAERASKSLGVKFLSLTDIASLGMGSAQKKLLRLLEKHEGTR